MDITIKMDLRELRAALGDVKELPEELREVAWRELRMAARHAQGQITIRMPKDWGHAQTSWGNNLTVPMSTGRSPRRKYPQPKGVKVVRGTWVANKAKMSVTMGGLHYIEYLNEGHSQQAPAGFIDKEIADAQDIFAKRMLANRLL